MSETTVRNGEWVTVIIAARNEASRIGSVISAVLKQAVHDQAVEVLVADDGSLDGTAGEARKAGARVVELPKSPGNPGAARNHGAQEARGGILIFLDADCLPQPGWLTAHLAEQDRGHPIVGGSLAIPSGLSWTARADYYVSSYHVHPDRRAGVVPGHTPANLSVRREVFAATSGFAVELPVADGHEELGWQSEAGRRGVPVYFQPRAIVQHFNRPGLGNLLRRSYRWGYSALEAKTSSGTSRVVSTPASRACSGVSSGADGDRIYPVRMAGGRAVGSGAVPPGHAALPAGLCYRIHYRRLALARQKHR